MRRLLTIAVLLCGLGRGVDPPVQIRRVEGAPRKCCRKTSVFLSRETGMSGHFVGRIKGFPENVMAFGGDEGELNQISSVSYEYEYDGTTHTGHLTVAAEDMDGQDTIAPLEFTYNDATDVITFNLPLFYADDNTDIITFNLDMFYAENGTPLTLTLNFSRNNE